MNLRIILIVLDTMSLFIQLPGIYALVSLYKNCTHKTQRLLIGNLSLCEILMNLLMTMQNIELMISPATRNYNLFIQYVELIITTGLNVLFYLSMYFITLDRLASVVLNIRYRTVWTTRSTIYLLSATWGLCITGTLVICLVLAITGLNLESIFTKYIHPTLDFGFILIALLAYTVIFVTYKKSSERVGNELKKSAFILPSLLVLTFLLFIILPDFIQLGYSISGEPMANNLGVVLFCLVLYRISPIADAVLYIFLLKDIRRFLAKKFSFRPCDRYSAVQRTSSNETENTNLLLSIRSRGKSMTQNADSKITIATIK